MLVSIFIYLFNYQLFEYIFANYYNINCLMFNQNYTIC